MGLSIGSLKSGVGQIIGRTILLQPNSGILGIPVPLAVLDVVKEERVDYTAVITEHPVEAGPEISDHIQLTNPTLRLKGVISSTPLDLSVAIANMAAGALAAITSSQAQGNLLNSGVSQGVGLLSATLQGNAGNVAANAFTGAVDAVSRTILLNAFQSATPFTVVTRRQSFSNMVIQRLSFPRNEETGYALEFEMDIKQLKTVKPITSSFLTVAANVISGAVPATSLGSQSTADVSPQTTSAVQGSNLGSAPNVAEKSPGFF